MVEYFPEFNIHFLELFGKRLAVRYSEVPIELILLTKHNPESSRQPIIKTTSS